MNALNPRFPRPAILVVLKVLIVMGELLCLLGQWFVFVISTEIVSEIPETTPGLWPYRIAGALGIACLEVAFAAVWPLLTLAGRQDVFSGKAIHWVNLIIGSAIAEGILVLAVLVFSNLSLPYVKPNGQVVQAALGAPMLELMLVVALLLIAAFVLLMWVMRSLLMQAIGQRRELEGVI
ncbi:hypothetical protein GSD1FS_0260 [Bifidobacterium sp. GSD1FS]|uniref:DUF2975 domain-containing protein n=1 Tax=Bifidobacterium canis TaxID=2610880 RepID=A0A7K1J318_9BIFI|nr:hypothetical protein [Bifidobacterium canis]